MDAQHGVELLRVLCQWRKWSAAPCPIDAHGLRSLGQMEVQTAGKWRRRAEDRLVMRCEIVKPVACTERPRQERRNRIRRNVWLLGRRSKRRFREDRVRIQSGERHCRTCARIAG